jgi:hypothetical protein
MIEKIGTKRLKQIEGLSIDDIILKGYRYRKRTTHLMSIWN